MQFFALSLMALASASPLLPSYGENGAAAPPSHPSVPQADAHQPAPQYSAPKADPKYPAPQPNTYQPKQPAPQYPAPVKPAHPSNPSGGKQFDYNPVAGGKDNHWGGKDGNGYPKGGNDHDNHYNGDNGGHDDGYGGVVDNICHKGAYSQCCAVNVLGLASLDCENVPYAAHEHSDFESACASVGKSANCCQIPILGQGIICNQL